jgi:hypothetical protein
MSRRAATSVGLKPRLLPDAAFDLLVRPTNAPPQTNRMLLVST